MTDEQLAEIRAALRTGRKKVSYVFIGRDLLRELDAVRGERDNWKAKYEATAAAWEESKRFRESDRKRFDELLEALRIQVPAPQAPRPDR